MVQASWDTKDESAWVPPQSKSWYKKSARKSSSQNMSQATIKEGYDITTLDFSILVDDLIRFLKRQDLYDKIKNAGNQSNELKSLRAPKSKEWLQATACPRLRDETIPAKFHDTAAGSVWRAMLSKIRGYGKIKTEEGNETPAPAPVEAERNRSHSVASNMTTASLTQQLDLATVTTKVILNDANVHIIDSVNRTSARTFPLSRLMSEERQAALERADFEIRTQHLKYNVLVAYLSQPKFSEWYTASKSEIFDALAAHPITDDDDLAATVNSHIKMKNLEGVAIEFRNPASAKAKPRVRFESPKPTVAQPESLGQRRKRRTVISDTDSDSDDENASKRQRREVEANRIAAAKAAQEEEAEKRKSEEEAQAKRDEHDRQRKEPYNEIPSDDDEQISQDEGDEEDEEVKSAQQLAKEEQQRLQALLNARTADALNERVGLEMEHCKPEEWEEAADFWGIPIEEFKKGQSLTLPLQWDLAIEFTPYQLCEAYILYKKERSTDNGGIFANMMGMGKTRSIGLMILLGHVHWYNWMQVSRDRAEGRTERHRAVEDGREQCPTADQWTFRCGCEDQPSMPEEPRLAPTLVSGWGRAPDAWKNEVVAMALIESKWCNPDDPLALRFCFMDNNPPADMGAPTEDEEVEMRIDPRVADHLANLNSNVAPREFTKDGKKQMETVPWTIADKNMPEVYPDATAHRPAPSAGRFIIVCGHTTVQKRVLKKYNTMRIRITRTITVKGSPSVVFSWLPIPGHVVVWGRIVFDEFHNCKSEDTIIGNLYTDLRKYNHGYQWKAWALSGTPMEKGLHEILIFISMALVGLEDKDGISNWDVPVGARHPVRGTIKYDTVDEVYKSIKKPVAPKGRSKATLNGLAMARAWESMITKAKDGVDNVSRSEEYNNLMQTGAKIASRFMLRRTLVTRDPWGDRISGINGDFLTFFRPCRVTDFVATVHDAAQRCKAVLIQEGENEQAVKDMEIFNRAEMQAIASYPRLATLKAALYEKNGSKKTKRFVSAHLQQYFKDPDNGIFADNLDFLTEGSAKHLELERECKTVSGDTTPNHKWSQAAEDEARKTDQPIPPREVAAKILIGSYKPAVQLIIWLAFRKKYGNHNVLLMKGGMTKSEHDEALAKWRDPNGPIILVASMAFAEAITLIEAITVVIVEPQDKQNTQDQFLFRVYRLGQLAAMCKGLIFYTPESQLEIGVLSKQFLKTASRDGLQGDGTVDGKSIEWDTDEDVEMKLEGLV